MKLERRTAIITGAAQGIGQAIAKAFHKEGAFVVIADLSGERAAATAATIDPQGERVWPVEVDVRDRISLQNLFDNTVDRLGQVDILVNNAAKTVSKPIWEISANEWDDILAVNLRSVLFGCQIAGPHMQEKRWGRIINLASLAGQQGGLVAGAHYAAAKAGVIVLTKIVARELAPHGVTANAIAPAAIQTPVMDSMSPAELDDLARRVPVGRLGKAPEVAALAVFLASEDAGYITGATLDINGGILMR